MAAQCRGCGAGAKCTAWPAAGPAIGLCYDDLEDETGLRCYAGPLFDVEIPEAPSGRYAGRH